MGRTCRALGTRCASPLWPRAAARLSRLRDRRPRELALQRGGAVQCRATGWRRAPRAGHGASTVLVAVCGNGRASRSSRRGHSAWGNSIARGRASWAFAVAGPCRLAVVCEREGGGRPIYFRIVHEAARSIFASIPMGSRSLPMGSRSLPMSSRSLCCNRSTFHKGYMRGTRAEQGMVRAHGHRAARSRLAHAHSCGWL